MVLTHLCYFKELKAIQVVESMKGACMKYNFDFYANQREVNYNIISVTSMTCGSGGDCGKIQMCIYM